MEISALCRSMGHASTATIEGYAPWTSGGLLAAYLAVPALFADLEQAHNGRE